MQVGKLRAGVVDDVDLGRLPASGEVGDHSLLKEQPVAGEGDEEGCVRGMGVLGKEVPGGDCWEGGVSCEREVVLYRRSCRR